MPTVKKGESQKEYLSRCIPVVMKEGGKGGQDHAIAKCIGMYKEAKKRKRAKGSMEEPTWDEQETKIAIILPPNL